MQSLTTKLVEIHGHKVKSRVSEDVIKQAQIFLHLNYKHNVDRVFPAKLVLEGKLHATWYRSPDHGGYPLFAVNKDGSIIYGLVFDEPSKSMSIYPADETDFDLESE